MYRPIAVTGISLNESLIILTNIGDTEQLTATITPADAEDTAVTWNSSDTNIAIVSNTGLVTCVTPGTATITVTTHDGGFVATCEVSATRLPSAYQEVEYISSATRGPYINTRIYPSTQTYTVELDIASNQNGTEYWAFGIWGNTGFRCGQWSSGSWDKNYGFSYDPGTYTLGTKTHCVGSNSGKGTSSSTPLGLFAMSENGSFSSSRRGAYKIYYCKIWNSGTLIRDYVPCYRKSDSVIGMYDLANNEFYTNNGSGSFVKGPDV